MVLVGYLPALSERIPTELDKGQEHRLEVIVGVEF